MSKSKNKLHDFKVLNALMVFIILSQIGLIIQQFELGFVLYISGIFYFLFVYIREFFRNIPDPSWFFNIIYFLLVAILFLLLYSAQLEFLKPIRRFFLV
jgi:hypothetical protein